MNIIKRDKNGCRYYNEKREFRQQHIIMKKGSSDKNGCRYYNEMAENEGEYKSTQS